MAFAKQTTKKQNIANLPHEELITQLKTSADGLSDNEAQLRLAHYGPNVLNSGSSHNSLKLIVRQFRSSLIYMLLVACILAFVLKDFNDGIVIALILLINAGLGYYQEFKSEKAIEKLQKLVNREILVKRDGKEVLIPENSIVPGDLVIVREGDIIPADARLLYSEELSVNESQLTGESVPVVKKILGVDSLIYAGSTVERGEGMALVYATGFATELGKIAHLSSSTKRITQYEQSLASFSSFLVRVTFLTLALIFVLKLLISHNSDHPAALALFIIVLAIAVVPEALPVIATVTLSRGALMLANRHVIAKTLTAVEDLGNITILCSDKTGTLTENKQTIKKLTTDDPKLFLHLAIASLETVDEKRKKSQSGFDQAFLHYVPQDIQAEARKYKRLKELPFDPAARRRRVVCTDGSKTYLIEVGSAETLLALTHDHRREQYLRVIQSDGRQGLRHLAIAYKTLHYTDDFDITKHEDGLDFVGFVALEDPLRTTAKHTIQLAEKLGVAIKILSGDSREVTQYVATEVGLIDKDQIVYTGDELEAMHEEELGKVVAHNNAFARLSPEQKYRIIKLLKQQNNIVGYQGDGINDAPALKLADVAIAVSSATDVARDSADILLLRSDIGVIINGIQYGRTIFSNINKYIRYTMIGNFGNFFALGALYLLSDNLPLLAIQLLLTNLLGDVPLITISTDNVELDELTRPSKYNIRSLIFTSMFLGTFTALFELFFYAIVKSYSVGIAQTSLYLYLTLLGFAVIFSVRNKSHFWRASRLSKPLIISFSFIAVLTVVMIYFRPTQRLFSFLPLSWSLLGIVLGMTLLYLFVLDLIKVWFYRSKIGSNYET